MGYNQIVSTDDMTVVSEYTLEERTRTEYQSEEELEEAMLDRLKNQGYEFLEISSSEEMVANLRKCMEELNNYQFTDSEWDNFFTYNICGKGGIQEKTRKIQTNEYIQELTKEDGTHKNIILIDKNNIHNNKLQVLHQYTTTGNYENRYDVTILVNGLPLVHCELKRRGIPIKQAFNQIERYQRDSFWSDNGLYEYVQIFIISNGTHTKYYSNTTRLNVVDEHNGKRKTKKEGSNSFEFTSYWADANNKTIEDLMDFTKTFLVKHTILSILCKYCVFTTKEQLLVMRPYQIVATERILNQIKIADNHKLLGTIDAGGFIWHTTGSGKTLTSFKTSQLASNLDCIDKVLFVVDRQDLDYQTMLEYERFQKGCANGNKSTKELTKQLENKEVKIIITTIQKLTVFCKQNDKHDIYNSKVALIFDECHRSQFGEQHTLITNKFKNYAIFGFTGTPIFSQNAKGANIVKSKEAPRLSTKNKQALRTTEQVFGKRLHTYTVVNAIADNNVLPFRIDYVNTIKDSKGNNTLIEAIDDEKILLAPDRVKNVVDYIIEHFDQKTRRSDSYSFRKLVNVSEVIKTFGKKDSVYEEYRTINRNGFNSIFAVSSIDAAKIYYQEFKKHNHNLKIALIYSYGVNEDNQGDNVIDEDSDSTSSLNAPDRDFLEYAINDYNKMFNTQYDTTNNLFSSYYKDVSKRMKNGDIDLLIVVNMFLTGFDATTLNTLWVDKNLRQHGLIQAFSRTNRILNDVKSYGNIICFRNLKKEVDDAVALFGDDGAKGIVILKAYNEYYDGYDEKDDKGNVTKHTDGYKTLVERLYKEFSLPLNIISEQKQKDFITLFGRILRLQNILKSFDDFEGNEIFTEADFQDYLSYYNDLYEKFKVVRAKEDVSADIVFEMELVKQVTVNIDYILALVAEHSLKNSENKEIPIEVIRAINSNPELRPKQKLIEDFILTLNLDKKDDVAKKWSDFKTVEKEKELQQIIDEGYDNKPLKDKETKDLIKKMFRNGVATPNESDICKIIPSFHPIFGIQTTIEAKECIKEKIQNFYLKYMD